MKKGISLIVLIVTIIVIVILASSVILSIANNNPIAQASEAVFKNNLKSFESELELSLLTKYASAVGASSTQVNAFDDVEVRALIGSLPDEKLSDIRILNNKLMYVGNDANEQEWARELGLIAGEDARYIMELVKVEEAIHKFIQDKAVDNTLQNVGTALSASNYVDIRGIVYSSGWYKVEQSDLVQLNVNSSTYAPYIVNYEDGTIINIAGRIINGTPVHYINYYGTPNELVKRGLLTAVNTSSIKNTDRWGELLLEQSIGTDALNTYSADGGLNLSESSNIGMLLVDQTRPINERYSLNITVKGTTNQNGSDTENLPATICALSDVSSKYILWMGIHTNILTVYAYSPIMSVSYTSPTNIKGYCSIDLSEYDNRAVNIQVTSQRSAKTKIYIDGILKAEFDSGDEIYTYNALTIGDLRQGRNLKYDGTAYNFALYSEILTDQEVMQNWNYTKNTFGL